MARRYLRNTLNSSILSAICLVGCGLIQSSAQAYRSPATSDVQDLRSEMDKLRAEITTLKKESASSRDALERQKLQGEIDKLKAENAALTRAAIGVGRLLPWLQAGLASLVGGMLVLIAGRTLTKIQQKKLTEEIRISGSEHDFKLFEALGSREPRIRLGAASELGQRVRELNARAKSWRISRREKTSDDRERMKIIRVLIAVTKHENNEELQKHIADLIVDVLEARIEGRRDSPLAQFEFQAARLTNAWWKGVDARGADFYKACLVRVGLANSKLSRAIFKNADLHEATLRDANAEYANFEGADMADIKAVRIDLTNAILSRANLEGADLRHASVAGADFSGAQMRKAKLQGVDFRSANLTGVDLSEAETDAETKIPLADA